MRALEAVPPDGAVTVSGAAAWTDLHDLDATELDDLELRHRSDAALDYAQHVPVRVIALLLGVPDSESGSGGTWGASAEAEADGTSAESAGSG